MPEEEGSKTRFPKGSYLKVLGELRISLLFPQHPLGIPYRSEGGAAIRFLFSRRSFMISSSKVNECMKSASSM